MFKENVNMICRKVYFVYCVVEQGLDRMWDTCVSVCRTQPWLSENQTPQFDASPSENPNTMIPKH